MTISYDREMPYDHVQLQAYLLELKELVCVAGQDARKASSLKQQLEMYKIQTHELQSKLADEIKRADKAEFEFKRVQEKMVTLQSERDVSC